jgi:hypothetical protein|tara:strand:+ start:773 stop:922 length:150 start_codon:yes stop_codon:yes gene_type:complete
LLPGGVDLQFCGHHWSRHEEALRPQAEEIIDETRRLDAIPADGTGEPQD